VQCEASGGVRRRSVGRGVRLGGEVRRPPHRQRSARVLNARYNPIKSPVGLILGAPTLSNRQLDTHPALPLNQTASWTHTQRSQPGSPGVACVRTVVNDEQTLRSSRPASLSLLETMSGSLRRSAVLLSTDTHTSPDVWRTMNAIDSGVILSAAPIRSPSFSRSSSSSTTWRQGH